MGCWSVDSFGNDDAADWLLELAKTSDMSLVRSTIAESFSGEEPLDSSKAARLLAAAEAVAGALGRLGSAALDEEELVEWIGRAQPLIDDAYTITTIKAVARVLDPECELRQLWEESGQHEEWLNELTGLLTRLRPNSAPKA